MVRPTALFDRNAQEYLVGPMAELGFGYSKKKRIFSREQPPFQQNLVFRILARSRNDYCIISPHIEITSDEYQRWYREAWGEEPEMQYPDILLSQPAYWIDGWPKKGNFLTRFLPWRIRPGGRVKNFYLRNRPSDRREMRELRDAMLGPLMDKLDEVTNWDGVAEDNLETFETQGYACDCYLIGGNRARALEVLENVVGRDGEFLEVKLGRPFDAFQRRYVKYFGEGGLFAAVGPRNGSEG